MQSDAVRFDDASRCSLSEQPVPHGGVPRALRIAAETAGLDPLAELYNEALRLATDGKLGEARDRVTMLITMAPEDGEARLLLARLHVAAQAWKEALATLDEAEACGVAVPEELRQAVEEHHRADEADDVEQRQALSAREQGEIKALRAEARRLRSENAQLVGRTSELEVESRRWAWMTAGVAAVASVLIFANLVLGGRGSAPTDTLALVDDAPTAAIAAASSEAPQDVPPGADAAPQAGSPAAAASTPVPEANKPNGAPAIAVRASNALAAAPGLDGTKLEVEVTKGEATLRGVVPTFRHRKTAEKVLLGIDGVKSVKADDVVVKARTEGTTHKVRGGDSLSKVAYEYYGEASRSNTILKANAKELNGKTDLSVGQTIKIPAIN